MDYKVDSLGRFVVTSDYDNDVVDLCVQEVEDILEQMKEKIIRNLEKLKGD